MINLNERFTGLSDSFRVAVERSFKQPGRFVFKALEELRPLPPDKQRQNPVAIPEELKCPIGHGLMRKPVEVVHIVESTSNSSNRPSGGRLRTVTQFFSNLVTRKPKTSQQDQNTREAPQEHRNNGLYRGHVFDESFIKEYFKSREEFPGPVLCPLCTCPIQNGFKIREDLADQRQLFLENHPEMNEISHSTPSDEFEDWLKAQELDKYVTITRGREGTDASSQVSIYRGRAIDMLVRRQDLTHFSNNESTIKEIHSLFNSIVPHSLRLEFRIIERPTGEIIHRTNVIGINPFLIEQDIFRLLQGKFPLEPSELEPSEWFNNLNVFRVLYVAFNVLMPMYAIYSKESLLRDDFFDLIGSFSQCIYPVFMINLAEGLLRLLMMIKFDVNSIADERMNTINQLMKYVRSGVLLYQMALPVASIAYLLANVTRLAILTLGVIGVTIQRLEWQIAS